MQGQTSSRSSALSVLRIAFVIALAVSALSGCERWKIGGIEIDARANEICWAWGQSLPTRSRRDTAQTKTEITRAYADFKTACPEHEHLIPE
jgi:hypothetical protein